MNNVALRVSEPKKNDKWFLVQLKPCGLRRAQENLHRQGIATLMPMHPETRRVSGSLTTTMHPLFPGYLFVSVDPEIQSWRTINNTYGVSRLVSLDGVAPSIVPPGIIDALLEESSGRESVPEPDKFQIGKPVSLVLGPFAGLAAKIASTPEDGRVFVLMEMMGQGVRAAVPLQAVEVVD